MAFNMFGCHIQQIVTPLFTLKHQIFHKTTIKHDLSLLYFQEKGQMHIASTFRHFCGG